MFASAVRCLPLLLLLLPLLSLSSLLLCLLFLRLMLLLLSSSGGVGRVGGIASVGRWCKGVFTSELIVGVTVRVLLMLACVAILVKLVCCGCTAGTHQPTNTAKYSLNRCLE